MKIYKCITNDIPGARDISPAVVIQTRGLTMVPDQSSGNAMVQKVELIHFIPFWVKPPDGFTVAVLYRPGHEVNSRVYNVRPFHPIRILAVIINHL